MVSTHLSYRNGCGNVTGCMHKDIPFPVLESLKYTLSVRSLMKDVVFHHPVEHDAVKGDE